jgi:YfiH family protein
MDEPFIQHLNSTLTIEKWAQLSPRLVAGFTTKHGGSSHSPYESNNYGLHVGDDSKDVITNRLQLSESLGFPSNQWACADQVHKDQIVKVTDSLKGQGVFDHNNSIKGTDGFYTNNNNVLLTLCYADCVPIYYYAPDHHMIGIAHAGWKGSVKNISGKMIDLWDMTENIPPSDVYVAIGPSIDRCCYVVNDQVIKQVDEVLKHISSDSTPYETISEGQYRLDLKTLNKSLLVHAGVKEENILVSKFCTSCQDDLFFSFRRDKGKTGRMISYIGFQDE